MKVAIDCFVLTKVNGMSTCLHSILNAIPFKEREHFVLLLPNDYLIGKVPEGYGFEVVSCKYFLLWENVLVPLIIKSLSKKFDSLAILSPANTSPFYVPKKVKRFLVGGILKT